MIEMKTPAMRLRNTIPPISAARTVGTTIAIAKPNHCDWNGVQRNDVFVMQQRSDLAPGSAFQNMKSGMGVSEPCCMLVLLASFSDIAIM